MKFVRYFFYRISDAIGAIIAVLVVCYLMLVTLLYETFGKWVTLLVAVPCFVFYGYLIVSKIVQIVGDYSKENKTSKK